ncbi:hypothetical protein SGFS_022420 [Streptomyces graminofaciens]|uniref:FAD-binding oxidoreductase/transferase type 4 C-terminal domain-containing protein n=1 Tax=Streptomyces graminofaciens TaxID=68212 RepID=A0ABM7F5K0_9ACTN|nr:FAD-linked oxidase C-terminal domain-containing protein [Streptomyces graminofaciens]BBC30948.1 hypothetical protein SGFS_022420 [Streptomyces graminofaciens]
MNLVAERFDFDDHSHMAMVERIKDALDPSGILSPGKQRIWPLSCVRGGEATLRVST